jgi:Virulence-associated protein E/Primase C terminal 2 (PriCT-2)
MDTAEFLARLGPVHFYRALWPKKLFTDGVEQPNPHAAPNGQQEVTIGYGPWSARFQAECARLNALGYGIYFGANDPGPGNPLDAKHCDKLRLIYRDRDKKDGEGGEEASPWQLANGTLVLPHLHWVTSPGSSQSAWLIEEISADHIGIIHNKMVEWTRHDASTSGAHRLLRLPGFLNTKYAEKPPCEVVSASDEPLMEAAVVTKHFGLVARLAGNASRLMHSAQSGSGGAATATVFQLDQERAKRGANSPEHERQVRAVAHTGFTNNQDREEVRQTLGDADPFERSDWFKVGAALHFMFRGNQDGLDLFEAWSALAPDKYQIGECDKLWQGFEDGREHVAHWGSLKAMSRQRMATPAAKARVKALEGAFMLLPAKLSIQTLAPVFPETIPAGDPPRNVPVAGSVANANYVYESIEPTLHYDEFAREERTERGAYNDIDENACFVDGMALGLPWSQAQCRATGMKYAQDHKRNPALDWYSSLEGLKSDGTPVWDGVKRLERLLIDHLGAEDIAWVEEVTRLHFIAMVRRILEPGCKYDYLLILRGKGETGKSSLFKQMMPIKSWFSDAPSFSEDSKRFYMLLQGKLCIEFAELEGMPEADINKVKKVITQQVDEYVGMYGRRVSKQPRIGVFVGTTNEYAILRDMTGNRRFPIISVTKELNFDAIAAVRDQVWAEAIELEKKYGPLRLSAETARAVEHNQSKHMEYEAYVAEFLDEVERLYEGFIANTTFEAYFGIDYDDRGKAYSGKIKFAIKQAKARLRHAGWKDTENPMWVNGKTKRGLYKREVMDDMIEIVHDRVNGLHHMPEGIGT